MFHGHLARTLRVRVGMVALWSPTLSVRAGNRRITGDTSNMADRTFTVAGSRRRRWHHVGFLKKFSGLSMEADIVANDLGPENMQKKHVSNIKWTPARRRWYRHGQEHVRVDQGGLRQGLRDKNGTFTSADFGLQGAVSADVLQRADHGRDGSQARRCEQGSRLLRRRVRAEQVRWAKAAARSSRARSARSRRRGCARTSASRSARSRAIASRRWSRYLKCACVRPDRHLPRADQAPGQVITPDIKFAVSYADHQAGPTRLASGSSTATTRRRTR